MNRMIAAAAAFALPIGGFAAVGVLAGPAIAAAPHVQTAKFAIENMTCATCPIAVKTVMEKVPGVQSVDVSFEAKTATVVFDPTKVKAETIAAASTKIGYPAALAQ